MHGSVKKTKFILIILKMELNDESKQSCNSRFANLCLKADCIGNYCDAEFDTVKSRLLRQLINL